MQEQRCSNDLTAILARKESLRQQSNYVTNVIKFLQKALQQRRLCIQADNRFFESLEQLFTLSKCKPFLQIGELISQQAHRLHLATEEQNVHWQQIRTQLAILRRQQSNTDDLERNIQKALNNKRQCENKLSNRLDCRSRFLKHWLPLHKEATDASDFYCSEHQLNSCGLRISPPPSRCSATNSLKSTITCKTIDEKRSLSNLRRKTLEAYELEQKLKAKLHKQILNEEYGVLIRLRKIMMIMIESWSISSSRYSCSYEWAKKLLFQIIPDSIHLLSDEQLNQYFDQGDEQLNFTRNEKNNFSDRFCSSHDSFLISPYLTDKTLINQSTQTHIKPNLLNAFGEQLANPKHFVKMVGNDQPMAKKESYETMSMSLNILSPVRNSDSLSRAISMPLIDNQFRSAMLNSPELAPPPAYAPSVASSSYSHLSNPPNYEKCNTFHHCCCLQHKLPKPSPSSDSQRHVAVQTKESSFKTPYSSFLENDVNYF